MRRSHLVAVTLAFSVLAFGAGPAVSGSLVLASTSDAGVKGTGESHAPSISADGTKTAFESKSPNLDPNDPDNITDIYVKDLRTGDITLASASDLGVKSDADSYAASLSADGTTVAFESYATNLDPDDTDTDVDIYVKDLTTGDITLASTSDYGVKGNAASYIPGISADGRAVAFYTDATNFDVRDSSGRDVYVKNLVSGDITLASTSDAGVKANDDNYDPSLSGDGSKVAFFSFATNLDPEDTDFARDIYVKDLRTGDITLASTSDGGVKGTGQNYAPDLSPDGTKVAFYSTSNDIDPADTDQFDDIYVKDLTTGDLTLASTTAIGLKSNGRSQFPSMSLDGQHVAFQSTARNLDPADRDGNWDVYVKDLVTGDLTLVSLTKQGVKGNRASTRPSATTAGIRVAFETQATNFDPRDTDGIPDTYVKQLP
jgi:Tol biopolymer transport system component